MAMSGASPNHSPKPGVSSPWSQIVAAVAPPSSPLPPVVDSAVANSTPVEDSSDNGNVNTGKRPAWNKPSNGASSSVMGADSWPALSESARAPAKSPSPSPSPSPSESAKASHDAPSVRPLQGTGSVVPLPQRHVRDNASVNNNNSNNTVQTHHKAFKRSNSNMNSNVASNGGHLPPPPMSAVQGSMAAAEPHNYNSIPKNNQPRAGFVSTDHPQHRNFRHRNGGGPHQRGDGHHHNYGGRRDQDRNHDWNNHRNFNGRDNFMAPRFGPRFIRPPPPPNPAQLYPPPPPMHPYGSMGFPELPPQMVYIPPPPLEPIRGVPFVAPMPPNAMYFQPPESPEAQLHARIVRQIDYYFSNENLIKDTYLRKRMDDQGWVSISIIAGFKKVQDMTDNVQTVLDALLNSSVVEVQGDKVRRRNDWRRWLMPPDNLPNFVSSQSIGQLAAQVQSLTLETTDNNDAGVLDVSQSRHFGDLNGQYLHSTSEGTGQVGIQVSDHSISAKN